MVFEKHYAKKVLKKCIELNAELNKLPYNLRKLEKTDKKKYDEIGIRLRDLANDIGKALKEITLPSYLIDELIKFRKMFGKLYENNYS